MSGELTNDPSVIYFFLFILVHLACTTNCEFAICFDKTWFNIMTYHRIVNKSGTTSGAETVDLSGTPE